MKPWAEALAQSRRASGLLVDTNLLLVKCVGDFRPELVAKYRRTDLYARFVDPLREFWKHASLITTPTILAEVSNLFAKVVRQYGPDAAETVIGSIEVMEEKYTPSRELAASPIFAKLGLTDAAIIHLAANRMCVFSADAPLCAYLASKKLNVINFNHMGMD